MDLPLRPTAEAGFFVLRNVHAVDRAEGNWESAGADVRCPFRDRMTRAASGDGEDISASFNEIFPFLLGEYRSRGKPCGQQQNKR